VLLFTQFDAGDNPRLLLKNIKKRLRSR